MWIVFACGAALFAGATAVLAKQGIRTTDSTVATAIRTPVVLAGGPSHTPPDGSCLLLLHSGPRRAHPRSLFSVSLDEKQPVDRKHTRSGRSPCMRPRPEQGSPHSGADSAGQGMKMPPPTGSARPCRHPGNGGTCNGRTRKNTRKKARQATWLPGPVLAETVGFEPTVRFLSKHSLSRGAPSASRSRLQKIWQKEMMSEKRKSIKRCAPLSAFCQRRRIVTPFPAPGTR